MALNHSQSGIMGNGTQDRNVGVMLDNCAQFGFMARPTELIEDDACNLDPGVERLVPFGEGAVPGERELAVDEERRANAFDDRLGGERLAEAEALAMENNVVDWVLANAKAVDKPVTFDELMGNAA